MVLPSCGSRKEPNQLSSWHWTARSLTCSVMEKPHIGLDECPRILCSCFRARNSDPASLVYSSYCPWVRCSAARDDFIAVLGIKGVIIHMRNFWEEQLVQNYSRGPRRVYLYMMNTILQCRYIKSNHTRSYVSLIACVKKGWVGKICPVLPLSWIADLALTFLPTSCLFRWRGGHLGAQ